MSRNRQAEVTEATKDVDFTKNKYQIELTTTTAKSPRPAPGSCARSL